jgi:hypothetical protein
MANEIIKGYKGFDKDLKCRGYQYEIGKTHETDEDVEICERGFHAVPEDNSPLDVFGFYAPTDDNGIPNRFCAIEASGTIKKSDDKIAASKLKVVAEIGIIGIVKAHVEWVLARVKKDDKKSAHKDEDNTIATNTGNYSAATNTGYQSAATNTGDCSAATNTGYQSAATNTGNYSAATNTGYQSAATNTGYQSAATNTGDCSAATNTGYQSAATNTGDYSAATNTGYQSAATNTGNYSAATNTGYQSAATNTGYQSAATNTGNYSAATNTGDCSAAEVSGKESVAIVTGKSSKARGALGCWLVLTERGEWDGETYPIIEVRAVEVDGKEVKENVWYELVGGKVVEA